MSQFPGFTLESYIEDFYLIQLREDQIKALVAIWEPIRQQIELGLDQYDFDHSWRDYNYFGMVDLIPKELLIESNKYLGLPND